MQVYNFLVLSTTKQKMITQEEKYDALRRILESQTFSKSTTSNVLLKFLVESSINNIEITASDIGRELFGSHYQHEKSEANVRVNIYHLRKKLDKYYSKEGESDPIKIDIEKGHYKVNFSSETKNKNKRSSIIYSFSAIFIIVLLIATWWSFKDDDKVWQDAFNNNNQTTLYLSPVFSFVGQTQYGKFVAHRDVHINSEEELNALIDSLPHLKGQYGGSSYNYVTFEDAATIRHFSHLFFANQSDFAVRKASDFTMNNIKEQNLIYLSPMRYPTAFSDVFNKLAKNSKFIPNSVNRLYLNYTDKEGKQNKIELRTDSKDYEHGIAAKFKSPNNTFQYMFFADHGLGLSAMSEYFTNADSLNAFSKNYLNDSEEFVVLFYVSGKERTNLDIELLLFDDNK